MMVAMVFHAMLAQALRCPCFGDGAGDSETLGHYRDHVPPQASM